MTRMTPDQLQLVADVLSNDRHFCNRYTYTPTTYGQRRALIGEKLAEMQLIRVGHYAGSASSIEDREQLRRYFDAHFSVDPDPDDSTYSKYDYLPTWLDVPNRFKPQPKKAKSAMDRNLAALLRSDAKTVHVKLLNVQSRKRYTYVSHLPLVVGDHVVVMAADEAKIGVVEVVDDEVKIEPGCDTEFYWVVDKIDMAAFEANKKRNDDIVAEAAVIVRENMRKSFAAQVLGAASGEQRDRLLALTGNNLPV